MMQRGAVLVGGLVDQHDIVDARHPPGAKTIVLIDAHRVATEPPHRCQRQRAGHSRLTNGCALECGVGFRQLRTCRRTRPGQLCRNGGSSRRLGG